MGASSEISQEGCDILWKSLVLECIQQIVTQRRVNLGTISCALAGTNVLQGWKGGCYCNCEEVFKTLRMEILKSRAYFIFKQCRKRLDLDALIWSLYLFKSIHWLLINSYWLTLMLGICFCLFFLANWFPLPKELVKHKGRGVTFVCWGKMHHLLCWPVQVVMHRERSLLPSGLIHTSVWLGLVKVQHSLTPYKTNFFAAVRKYLFYPSSEMHGSD